MVVDVDEKVDATAGADIRLDSGLLTDRARHAQLQSDLLRTSAWSMACPLLPLYLLRRLNVSPGWVMQQQGV
jgi:hypothetical protein